MSMDQDGFKEARAEMTRYIGSMVDQAFDAPDEIEDAAVEMAMDELGIEAGAPQAQELRTAAAEELRAALVARIAEQAKWPSATECDMLDDAFESLEAQGIVSRQHFTCCGTCGVAEIGDEMEQARTQARSVKGYSFYHMQDTERAVEGGGLYLSYGSADDGEEKCLEVATEIVKTLRSFGFEPQWDGTTAKRIYLPIKWQRRFRLPRG